MFTETANCIISDMRSVKQQYSRRQHQTKDDIQMSVSPAVVSASEDGVDNVIALIKEMSH